MSKDNLEVIIARETSDGDLVLSINGKRYEFSVDTDIINHFKRLLRHNKGNALAYLRKKTSGAMPDPYIPTGAKNYNFNWELKLDQSLDELEAKGYNIIGVNDRDLFVTAEKDGQIFEFDINDLINKKVGMKINSSVPDPKFKLGDKVFIVDGNNILDEGEVSFISGYDEYIGQWQYKVKTKYNRLTYNENSLTSIYDDDEEVEEVGANEIFFYIEHRGKSCIIKVTKEDRWYEELVCGDNFNNIGGKDYMSYLTPNDIQNWLIKDFESAELITEEEAEEKCSEYEGTDYDEEDEEEFIDE
jgi:hypothetical protein